MDPKYVTLDKFNGDFKKAVEAKAKQILDTRIGNKNFNEAKAENR